MEFYRKLRKYVGEKNTSYNQLAEDMGGPSASTVTRWGRDPDGEKKPATPDIDDLILLAKVTEIPVAYWADPTIEKPEGVGGAAALPEAERKALALARQLGADRAIWFLQTIIDLGDGLAVSRLLDRED